MNGALAGLVILAIGDSQMMNLITNLHSKLEDAGAVVHSYAMCGATAADWVSPSTTSCGTGERHDKSPAVFSEAPRVTWNIGDLIKQYRPNLVVVELGDTMAGYGSQIELPWVLEQVHALTGKIAANNVACVWVGPTWGQDVAPYHKSEKQVRDISELLARSVAPCKYIDSTAFARPGEWPTRDGGHFQPDGYRKWGTAIADAIVRLNGQGGPAAR
jgi:hypothetical protein